MNQLLAVKVKNKQNQLPPVGNFDTLDSKIIYANSKKTAFQYETILINKGT